MRSREAPDALALPPAAPPHLVRFPTNVQHWDHISFLHWAVAPGDVQRLLPEGLHVEVREGSAWVGVTPFVIRVRPVGVPLQLPHTEFPETNVRTYVVGPDGPAIWFLHMEVTAWWFIVALRALGLPYVRRAMDVTDDGGVLQYRSHPGHGERGGHDIAVRPGRRLDPPTGDPLAQFLTARWASYHRVGPVLLRTPVDHQAWELHAGVAERCDVAGLFDASGLHAPEGPPLVHVSPGVEARIGRPRIVR